MNNKNFDSEGHELLAGVAAGMLIDSIRGESVYDAEGQATPYIDVKLPDGIPFPVRGFRLRVEPPLDDFTMADFFTAVNEFGDAQARRAAKIAAEIVGLDPEGELTDEP